MKKKRLLPFKLLPASWGLTGRTRQVAEAEYYYSGEDLEYRMLEIDNPEPVKYQIAKLDLDLKKEKITQAEHDKQVAEILNKPYVNVLAMGINPENVVQGYFELDWNDEFVKMLQSAGITGMNDEEIVNKWFNGVCRTVLLQEQVDQDYGMQTQNTKVRPDVEYRSNS